MRAVDWTGRKIGKLTVVRFICSKEYGGRTRRFYECLCDCGTTKELSSDALHKDRSCGCRVIESIRERSLVHGATSGYKKIPEYRAWINAKNRIRNPNLKDYPRYGGRGISMHPSWWNDFSQFLKDVGCRPSPLHSIDRINPDGNYEPGNVRWATAKEQANNRSNSKARLNHGHRE